MLSSTEEVMKGVARAAEQLQRQMRPFQFDLGRIAKRLRSQMSISSELTRTIARLSDTFEPTLLKISRDTELTYKPFNFFEITRNLQAQLPQLDFDKLVGSLDVGIRFSDLARTLTEAMPSATPRFITLALADDVVAAETSPAVGLSRAVATFLDATDADEAATGLAQIEEKAAILHENCPAGLRSAYWNELRKWLVTLITLASLLVAVAGRSDTKALANSLDRLGERIGELVQSRQELVAPAFPADARTIAVSTRVHRKPKRRSALIGTLARGQEVTWLDTHHRWVLVSYWDHRTGDKRQGWVLKKYLFVKR